MSLETAITEMTAALKENTALLKEVLARDTATAPTTEKVAETKPKSTTKPAADKTTSDEITYEGVKAKAAAWLGEHPKGSEEQAARRAYLETELWPKLKITKLGELEGKPAELKKVDTWLDGKAKTDLLGYGVGIFAKPAADDAGGDAGGEEEL